MEKELLEKKKKSDEEKTIKQEQLREKKVETEVFKEYKEDVKKYEHLKNRKMKSGKEDKTIELLKAFKERMFKAKYENIDPDTEKSEIEKECSKVQEIEQTETILTHRLDVDEEIKRKVIDANIADHERYDIYDPRNPLNKRKRGECQEVTKQKKKSFLTPNSL